MDQEDQNVLMLQTVTDQAMMTAIGQYAMKAQLSCQSFCEQKSIEDAQDLANTNIQNLTKDSIDALEL